MDRWLACEHSERPYGPGIEWHLNSSACRACAVRYQVDRLHLSEYQRALMDSARD